MDYVTLTLMLGATLTTLLPSVPGALLVWAIALAHMFLTGSAGAHMNFLVLTGVLAVSTMMLEFVSAKNDVRPFRASVPGAVFAVIGGLIGAFFGVVPTFTIGPILGALVGELLSGRDTKFILQLDRHQVVGSYAITFLRLGVALIVLGGWMSRELS